MRFAVVLVASVVMSGCATPPGQLKHDDLDWTQSELSIPADKTFAGLQNYARACGGILGQSPEWYPTSTGEGAKVDLFMRGLAGQTDLVYGVIELAQSPQGGTIAKTGVQTVYSKPMFRKRGWWVEKVQTMFSEISAGKSPTCS